MSTPRSARYYCGLNANRVWVEMKTPQNKQLGRWSWDVFLSLRERLGKHLTSTQERQRILKMANKTEKLADARYKAGKAYDKAIYKAGKAYYLVLDKSLPKV